MIAVADTSVLVAAINRRDDHHDECAGLVRRWLAGGIVVTAAVAVEVDYLIRSRAGASAARAFLADLDAGRYIPEPVDVGLFRRAVELDRQDADLSLGLGLADGTVTAAAERHHADVILTLDDHYRVAAPGFTVVP